jgi:hypothetical protein
MFVFMGCLLLRADGLKVFLGRVRHLPYIWPTNSNKKTFGAFQKSFKKFWTTQNVVIALPQ